MATFTERPSGTVGHYADSSQYPIWCDHPEDWEGLECQLVDQQVTRGMIERAKGVSISNTLCKAPPDVKTTRKRKKNNVVLKGDETTIAKGTTYE